MKSSAGVSFNGHFVKRNQFLSVCLFFTPRHVQCFYQVFFYYFLLEKSKNKKKNPNVARAILRVVEE